MSKVHCRNCIYWSQCPVTDKGICGNEDARGLLENWPVTMADYECDIGSPLVPLDYAWSQADSIELRKEPYVARLIRRLAKEVELCRKRYPRYERQTNC